MCGRGLLSVQDVEEEVELAVALAATQIAAKLCQRVQASVTAQALEKRDKSPVTVADFASQAIIASALKRVFPEIPLIAEEDSAALRTVENTNSLDRVVTEVRLALDDDTLSADTICEWIDHGGASEYSELFWTLDPIDGTKGFLRGQQYAIALALVFRQVIPALFIGLVAGAWVVNGLDFAGFWSGLLDSLQIYVLGAAADEDPLSVQIAKGTVLYQTRLQDHIQLLQL